jgi:tetratricopeptide (TPR) repeat protein
MAGVALPVRASLTAAVLLVVAALWGAAAGAQATDAGRVATFERFRAALSAGNLPEAAVHAQALVADTEAQYGRESRELVNPLSNLGTIAYRRGDFAAAETAYERAIGLVEGRGAAADPLLVRPLVGLGEVRLATGRHEDAAVAFKRALDISRNLDGLFNAAQLDIIDPLIECYVALDRLEDAEKEHQYAFRVAESAYGRGDPRMLDPLDRLARWYEFVGRYTTARGLHARALQISEATAGAGVPSSVPALRGLARTYYLEAIYGPEEPESAAAGDPFAMGPGTMFAPPPQEQGRLNPEGERALRFALDVLSRQQPPDRRARGETLVELADWYLVAGALPRALPAYAEGWKELEAAGGGAVDVLLAPRRLAYKAPPASISRMRPEDPTAYEERHVELSFTVTADGRVADVQTLSTDAPQNIEKSTQFALRRARYAPRLEAGVPVDTPGVRLRETVLVRLPKESRE